MEVEGEFNSLDTPRHHSNIHEYVRKHICFEKCSSYKKDHHVSGEVCVCGRDKEWHDEDITDLSSHIPAFGTIKFTGCGKRIHHNVPYLKVENYTRPSYMSNIWSVMHEYWGVPSPRLIINVSGGAKRFDLTPRLNKALKTGLIECATSTGAWIITGGTNAGVRKLVGEAVRDYYYTENASEKPVVALGVTTWELMHNHKNLQSPDGKGLFPARYDYDEEEPSRTTKAYLDPNHTHFLLVEKGYSKARFSNSIFRGALSKVIKMPSIDSTSRNDEDLPVPKVCVIINGGLGTIDEVWKNLALSKEPVVIVQGSGRASDYMAKAFQMVKVNDVGENQFPDDFDSKMTAYAKDMFEWQKESDIANQSQMITKCIEVMRGILDHRHLVNIYNIDSEYCQNLYTAILELLFKGSVSDLATQLHFTLSWNEPNIAEQTIFNSENKQQWKKQEYTQILYKLMFRALCLDQVEFVELFLDNGVEWSKFLTVRVLRDLYYEILVKKNYSVQRASGALVYGILQNEIMNEGGYHCCNSEVHSIKTSARFLSFVGKLIAKLMNNPENIYSGKQFVVQDELPKGPKKQMAEDVPIQNCTRELFFWAVLLNRRKLAMIFWKECNDCLGGALVASAILKGLSEYAEQNAELEHSQDLMDHALSFEQHAIGVLHECYRKNKESTHLLLARENDLWCNNTVFNIAYTADLMDFMEQSPCQTKLSKVWYGRMVVYTGIGKVLACMICPLMIMNIKFTESSFKPEDMKMVKSMGELGTNFGRDSHVSPEGYDDISPNSTTEEYHKDKVYSVRCCGGCGDRISISATFALLYFYHAPVVKFVYHTISFLLFLGLFSYLLLVDLRPISNADWISGVEILVWIWAFTMWLEEFRQMYFVDNLSFTSKLSFYFSSPWNIFDQCACVLLLISVILKCTLSDQQFYWARITYCFSLAFYYMRFLEVFFVERTLGPKVIMINRMLKDLGFFLLIVLVFLLCYGTVSQALRNPNTVFSWTVLRNIFYEPYWNVYGELFLENIEANDCSSNETALALDKSLKRCEQTTVVIYIFFALYMLMINILLLNLLIAMFSHTFQKVQDNALKVWRFYRYGLIYEYNDRPTLPPPLIIITHFLRIMSFFYRKMKNMEDQNTEFNISLPEEENSKLSTMEQMAMERYLYTLHSESQQQSDVKLSNTGKRVEKISSDMDYLKEQFTTQEGRSLERQDSTSTNMFMGYHQQQQNELAEVKNSLESLKTQMNTIMESIQNMNTERNKPVLERRSSQLNTWVAKYHVSNVHDDSDENNDTGA